MLFIYRSVGSGEDDQMRVRTFFEPVLQNPLTGISKILGCLNVDSERGYKGVFFCIFE